MKTIIIFFTVLFGLVAAQPFASFTSYDYKGCNSTLDNGVTDLYLYPADGSCFFPSGGDQFDTKYAYQITYNQTELVVFEFYDLNCSKVPDNTRTYTIDTCTENCVVSIFQTLPPDQYWVDLDIVGPGPNYYPWQTVLVTTYYSQVECGNSTVSSISVQGWQECWYGLYYYCQNDQIRLDSCSSDTCSSGCSQSYPPLNDSCTPSVNAPPYWQMYLDSATSAAYQATCVGGVPPSPSPSPSSSPAPASPSATPTAWATASASPSATPAYTVSPSSSPVPSQPFASFTTWWYDGCNDTANNYVYDVYLYPADGSCFIPSGGYQFYSYYSYNITYNESTVTVFQYTAEDCSSNPDVIYYPIDTCPSDSDCVASVWPTLPPDQYWTTLGIIGLSHQTWETVLVTNYYTEESCSSSATTIQVQGWPLCYYGNIFYCQNNAIHYEACTDTETCSSGCEEYYPPLNNTCMPSDSVSFFWSSYIDYTTSVSFQATCVQGAPPTPTPTPTSTPTPYRSPSITPSPSLTPTSSPTPYRSPSASPSPFSSGPYASFTTWWYDGCNATTNNYIYDLYIYPADGSCFAPAGGYVLPVDHGYRITYNSDFTVTIQEYTTMDCSSPPYYTYNYRVDTCPEDFDYVVSVYQTLPPDQYWANLDLVGFDPWETVLVTSYFSASGCQTNTLTTISVQGFIECSYGIYTYCDDGEIHYDSCTDTETCSSGCVQVYEPLNDACTISSDVPDYWSWYIDWSTSASYQASCETAGNPFPSASPSSSDTSALAISVVVVLAALALVF